MRRASATRAALPSTAPAIVSSCSMGRDQLGQNWPKLYTVTQGAELPAEELLSVKQGDNFGWPYCYYDGFQKKLVLAPEYGGDGGKTVGRCAAMKGPVAAYPAHWGAHGPGLLWRRRAAGRLQGRAVHQLPRLVEPRTPSRRTASASSSSPWRQARRAARRSCSRTVSQGPTRGRGRRRASSHRPACGGRRHLLSRTMPAGGSGRSSIAGPRAPG